MPPYEKSLIISVDFVIFNCMLCYPTITSCLLNKTDKYYNIVGKCLQTDKLLKPGQNHAAQYTLQFVQTQTYIQSRDDTNLDE